MKYADMVGHYVTGGDGVYRTIEYYRSHGFYLQAVSSTCKRPWRDISERAIDRTFYGDWHPNFRRWECEWIKEHPEIALTPMRCEPRPLEELEGHAEGLMLCFANTPGIPDIELVWLRFLSPLIRQSATKYTGAVEGTPEQRLDRLALMVETLAVCASVADGHDVEQLFTTMLDRPRDTVTAGPERLRRLDAALNLLGRWFLTCFEHGAPEGTPDLRLAIVWAQEASKR